jgi:hypothetical protein
MKYFVAEEQTTWLNPETEIIGLHHVYVLLLFSDF